MHIMVSSAVDWEKLFHRLKEIKHEGGWKHTPYEVVVRPMSPLRTDAQNRMYWVLINELSQHTGETPNRLHEIAKAEFLPRETITHDGETLVLLKSTTELTVDEFKQFLQQVQAWVMEQTSYGGCDQ